MPPNSATTAKISSALRILRLGSLAAWTGLAEASPAPPLTEIIDQAINGAPHKLVALATDDELYYRIQSSQEAESWSDLYAFAGTGHEVVLPLVELGGNGSPPPNGGISGTLISRHIRLQAVQSGGFLMSFNSVVNEEYVRHYLPSLTLGSNWTGSRLAYGETADFFLFVQKESTTLTNLPPLTQTLTIPDAFFRTQVLGALPNMDSGATFGQGVPAVLPVLQANGKALIRVKADYSDKDRDGIYDKDEPTYGTDPEMADSDGDGVLDGAEIAQDSNPNDNQSKPTDTNGVPGGPRITDVQGRTPFPPRLHSTRQDRPQNLPVCGHRLRGSR